MPAPPSPVPAASPAAFAPHPLRGAVLAEVHARPFRPLTTPRRLLHFAFLTDPAQAAAARAALAAYCAERGVEGPREGAKHAAIALADAALRFEQHAEFTTYTWEVASPAGGPFVPPPGALPHGMAALPQPGAHLVSADLHLLLEGPEGGPDLAALFDPASLVASLVDGGRAVAATDFRAGAEGFVRLLVLDRALTPAAAGALAQRLLEVETYRMLALMGLPETAALGPAVRRVEASLARLAGEMTRPAGLPADRALTGDRALLDELTGLAAELEAGAAGAAYRFGATRAYDEIVSQRLEAIDERPFGGQPSFAGFLSRRMGPAMRTCRTLEARVADLSEKLARAADLLRTRVDVEIAGQNRDVLASMNERARLQLRLQRTVEGLSVAAVSYYVVGLVAYLAKGAKEAGLIGLDPGIAAALAVPAALLLVWLVIRRIRRGHAADEPPAA